MQYMKKDDIIRMSQMYDCSCKVRKEEALGLTVLIGSFNEDEVFEEKNLVVPFKKNKPITYV